MPGNELSLEQYQTKAMLLGMFYDPRDHTVNYYHPNGIQMQVFDADTLEPVDNMQFGVREKLVTNRGLGPNWLHEMTEEQREAIWIQGAETRGQTL